MKLISIQLCNFRQFYGKTPEIVLASGARNTTIIHGNNGAGKTTLLNAFTWVLYEKFSAAFAAENQLVNKQAITEAEIGQPVECWVEINFEHDNNRYLAKRLCRAYKVGVEVEHSPSELRLLVAGEDGRWLPPQQQPEHIIGKILPASLYQYFFFDGERIEQIVRDDKKSEIAEATKELLGLKVLNRGIDHLKNVKKMLENELAAIGDIETKSLLRTQRKLVEQIEDKSKRQTEIAQELQHQEELKKEISNRLLQISGTQELQKLKDELLGQKAAIIKQLNQDKDKLKRAISSRGHTIFLSELTAKFRCLVDDWRARGELPTGIKRQFVQDLLERHSCICGAELIEGSHAYQLVQAWMGKAGMADIEETAILMQAKVDEVDQQKVEFWQEVDLLQNQIEQARSDLSRIETQIDDLQNQLRNYPNEDISKLQKRLDEIEALIRELTLEKGANQQQIDNLKIDVETKDKEIAKHKMKEERQVLAQRRIAVTQAAIERITEVRTRLDQQFRWQLEKRVQEIFSRISFTPYLPCLSEKYELNLLENTAGQVGVVAASTGENQILSLSFIGGIIDRVREWSKRNTLMGPDSSTLPVVMDSPFGSLDEIYRRQVAKIIPELANQLIVLVTKTQWRGEVEQEMAGCIGRAYVLSYNSPKPSCEEDSIVLGGERYPLVKHSSNQFEYTEILEVRCG